MLKKPRSVLLSDIWIRLVPSLFRCLAITYGARVAVFVGATHPTSYGIHAYWLVRRLKVTPDMTDNENRIWMRYQSHRSMDPHSSKTCACLRTDRDLNLPEGTTLALLIHMTVRR